MTTGATPLALYRPGVSPLHRLPAGAKVLAVFVAGTALLATARLSVLAPAFLLTALLHTVAGIPWRVVVTQVRPTMPVLVLLCGVQWLATGPQSALVVVLRLGTLILLALLVTLTTRVSDMIRVVERALHPLRRFGVPTAKVSLAISMTLRFIPLLAQVVHDVRDAQRARGGERSMVALVVPVLVRALRTADQVAEAIEARAGGADA